MKAKNYIVIKLLCFLYLVFYIFYVFLGYYGYYDRRNFFSVLLRILLLFSAITINNNKYIEHMTDKEKIVSKWIQILANIIIVGGFISYYLFNLHK